MGKWKNLLSDEEYYGGMDDLALCEIDHVHSAEALAINALREAARLSREAGMDWDTAEGTMKIEFDYLESKNDKQN